MESIKYRLNDQLKPIDYWACSCDVIRYWTDEKCYQCNVERDSAGPLGTYCIPDHLLDHYRFYDQVAVYENRRARFPYACWNEETKQADWEKEEKPCIISMVTSYQDYTLYHCSAYGKIYLFFQDTLLEGDDKFVKNQNASIIGISEYYNTGSIGRIYHA